MWIKICGNTSLEDAGLAVDAGADALGFIFAPSPRRVTPAQAATIKAHLPEHVETYGVFVDAALDQILAAVKQAGLLGVQLHTLGDPALPARLRREAPHLKILRVLHFPANSPAPAKELGTQLEQLQQDGSTDAVLIDSRTAAAPGGTGQRYDWSEAARIFRATAPHPRLVVAGGLSPANVAEAIRTLQPWGMDVVTGVEAAPGRKDPEKVRALIQNARAAAIIHRLPDGARSGSR